MSTILLIFEAEFTESVLNKLYYEAHRGWARRKIFLIKVLRWLENAVLRLVFTNSVFCKREMLLIFEAEFTGSKVQASFATCFLLRSAFGILRRITII